MILCYNIDMIDNPYFQSLEAERREHERALCHLFAGKIKKTFLLKVLHSVQETVGPNIQKYFDFNITLEKTVAGTNDVGTINYEVCRYIVGIHRSNLVFLTEDERVAKEKDDDYCRQLVADVIDYLKLRQYAGSLFRKKPILRGENFICFPLPYDLFAICARMNTILYRHQAPTTYPLIPIFNNIATKGLAALAMLEDNILDNAYPICRGAMELYSKMLLLINEPQLAPSFFKFVDYEVDQTCCAQKYPKEFNDLFDNRLNKNCKNKVEYLHFGWLDGLKDYHKIVKQKPYSVNGIITYLRTQYEESDADFFDHFEQLYKMCHGYTHGNISHSLYPLLHYFEISIMLYYVLSHTYKIICEMFDESEIINEVDIVARSERDFTQLAE